MPLIRGYLAYLGGASRPPVHPPGTAAHGRVLARSASEAGAERQRSGSRRVQRGTPRSRTTREHIRDTHGTHRGRTGHQQPLTPRFSPLTACRAIPRGIWRGAPHSTPCAHTLRAVPCSTTRESPRHSTPGAHALHAVPCYTTRESPRHSTPGTHALRAVPHSTTRPLNCPSLSRGAPP